MCFCSDSGLSWRRKRSRESLRQRHQGRSIYATRTAFSTTQACNDFFFPVFKRVQNPRIRFVCFPFWRLVKLDDMCECFWNLLILCSLWLWPISWEYFPAVPGSRILDSTDSTVVKYYFWIILLISRDLSNQNDLESSILECFLSPSNEVKSAASFALGEFQWIASVFSADMKWYWTIQLIVIRATILASIVLSFAGNIASGNLQKYMPYLLNEIEVSPKKEYLLLHSLKEVSAYILKYLSGATISQSWLSLLHRLSLSSMCISR